MTYHLVQAAIEDLESIDDDTVRTWDAEQADRRQTYPLALAARTSPRLPHLPGWPTGPLVSHKD